MQLGTEARAVVAGGPASPAAPWARVMVAAPAVVVEMGVAMDLAAMAMGVVWLGVAELATVAAVWSAVAWGRFGMHTAVLRHG